MRYIYIYISINAISNGLLLHSSCGHIIKDILFAKEHICKQGNALADVFAKRVKFSFPLLV